MSKVKNWISDRLFGITTGTRMETINDGKPVEQDVIRHRGYYIELMFDQETGVPVNWSWSEDPTMFNVPLRDIYIVERNQKSKADEAFKSGFYSGQGNAGVELEDCHSNWKEFNSND